MLVGAEADGAGQPALLCEQTCQDRAVAGQVQHHAHAVRAERADLGGQVAGVIDHLGRTEAANELGLRTGTGGRDHAGAGRGPPGRVRGGWWRRGGEIGLEAAALSSMLADALSAAELSKMLADLALKLGHAPLQRGEPCRVQSPPSSQLGMLAGRRVGEHRSDR
jgi:hypothetical protein